MVAYVMHPRSYLLVAKLHRFIGTIVQNCSYDNLVQWMFLAELVNAYWVYHVSAASRVYSVLSNISFYKTLGPLLDN